MIRWFVAVDSEKRVTAFDVRANDTPEKTGSSEWCFVDAFDLEGALEKAQHVLGFTRKHLEQSGFTRGHQLPARLEGHPSDCGCPACRASA